MPYQKISVRPGFNTQSTQTLNEGGWSTGNLVRFRNSLLERIAGWTKILPSACAGIVRAIHAYADIYGVDTFLFGTDGGAQVYANGVLSTQNLYKNIGTGVTFSVTAGNQSVTVSSVPFTTAIGDLIEFPQSVSVGGHLYVPGSVVQVLTESSGTFTFNLPAIATITTIGIDGVARLQYGTYDSDERHVQVTFYGHGLSVGGTFTFDLQTTVSVSINSTNYNLSVLAATPYPVIAVIDANTFVIDVEAFKNFPVITLNYLEGSVFNGSSSINGPQIGDLGTPSGSVTTFPTSTVFIPGHSPLGLLPLGAGNYTLVPIYTPVSPSFAGVNWSTDNFGEYGLFCQSGGPIYQYTPPLASSPGLANLGSLSPQINTGMFVAMPQAQIIAFGSETTIGGGTQDPLLVRWSDVGNQNNFIATITNQAGSNRLSRGSEIIGGIQSPQTSLLWTDIDLWSMTYVGVGDDNAIYSFDALGTGCGLIALNARCVLGQTTYWMGQQMFWLYGSNGVTPIECPVWDVVFKNLNPNYISRIFAGANAVTQEVVFYYPSLASTGENDSYVKMNILDNTWEYGSLVRTAWEDQSVFGTPVGADGNFNIQQHETGYDNDGEPIAGAYAETGFFDISDGDQITFFDLVIPDLKWFGTGGYVQMTIWATDTPGTPAKMFGPYPITPTSGIVSTGGIRARQIALRIDWGLAEGFNARLGAFRARMAPAGRA